MNVESSLTMDSTNSSPTMDFFGVKLKKQRLESTEEKDKTFEGIMSFNELLRQNELLEENLNKTREQLEVETNQKEEEIEKARQTIKRQQMLGSKTNAKLLGYARQLAIYQEAEQKKKQARDHEVVELKLRLRQAENKYHHLKSLQKPEALGESETSKRLSSVDETSHSSTIQKMALKIKHLQSSLLESESQNEALEKTVDGLRKERSTVLHGTHELKRIKSNEENLKLHLLTSLKKMKCADIPFEFDDNADLGKISLEALYDFMLQVLVDNKKENTNLAAEKSNYEGKLEQMSAENDYLERQISKLRKQFQQLKDTNDELMEEREALKKQNSRLKVENESLAKVLEVDGSSGTPDMMQKHVKKMRESLNTVEAERKNFVTLSTLSRVESQLQESFANAQQLEQENKILKSQNNNLQKTIESFSATSKEKRKRLLHFKPFALIPQDSPQTSFDDGSTEAVDYKKLYERHKEVFKDFSEKLRLATALLTGYKVGFKLIPSKKKNALLQVFAKPCFMDLDSPDDRFEFKLYPETQELTTVENNFLLKKIDPSLQQQLRSANSIPIFLGSCFNFYSTRSG